MSPFILIKSGYYEIGADIDGITTAALSLNDPVLKPVHLAASAPSRKVYIDEFKISKKLTGVHEFSEFIRSTGYVTESEKEGWGWIWANGWQKMAGVSWDKPFGEKIDELYRNGEYPVMQVSWNDAVQYTEWKSLREKEKIRLPYENEWEAFAQTIGIKSLTSVAAQPALNISNAELFLKGLGEGNEYQTGLLWEWTLDWYEGYSTEQKNNDFGKVYKVLRGGSLLSNDIQRTRDFRFRRCPTARSPYYGFRIVKTV